MRRADQWWQAVLGPQVDPQASLELSWYVYEHAGKGMRRRILEELVNRLWR